MNKEVRDLLIKYNVLFEDICGFHVFGKYVLLTRKDLIYLAKKGERIDRACNEKTLKQLKYFLIKYKIMGMLGI